MTEITAWYARNGRHDLPWRRTRDRWAVLVSEVMLHQTQVPRVAAAWPEFYGRFPTPGAMADAGPGAVIQAWGTLGYPRRARRLWEASVAIAAYGLARRPDLPPRSRPVHGAGGGSPVRRHRLARGRGQRPACGRTDSRARARGPRRRSRPGRAGRPAPRAGSPARADGRRRAGLPAARPTLRRVPAAPAVCDPRRSGG